MGNLRFCPIFSLHLLFSSHCRFQSENQNRLVNFGDELPIPLYVEVNDDPDIKEFLDSDAEPAERIREWALIPKRLMAGVNFTTIQTDDGNELKVATIGELEL